MKDMTKEFLAAAFAGESQAHMKYLAFAEQAEKDGKPHIANLFRATAHAERVHATNHLKALGKVAGTADNLGAAKGGEDFEIDEMYPAYRAVAAMQGEKQAERSMVYAEEAEKLHSKLYAAAQAAVAAGEDLAAAKVWVCPVCGYTSLDAAPEKCPVCNALQRVFKEFAA
jgi:rubrerythrin